MASPEGVHEGIHSPMVLCVQDLGPGPPNPATWATTSETPVLQVSVPKVLKGLSGDNLTPEVPTFETLVPISKSHGLGILLCKTVSPWGCCV